MQAKEIISEIYNVSTNEFSGGKSYLLDRVPSKRLKPLPGGSGFHYDVTISRFGEKEISLFDNKKLIGELTLGPVKTPIPNSWQVDTVTIDEDYRGQGLGTSLYGIALSILKLTLVAGESQTTDGKRQWLRLANIPGVEVFGYAAIFESLVSSNTTADKTLDLIAGIGGDFFGTVTTSGNLVLHYFKIPVTTTKSELKNAIKSSKLKIYSDKSEDFNIGLMAIWTGK